MKITHYQVTLTVNVDVHANTDKLDASVEHGIKNALEMDTYDEGRYGFDNEMLANAMGKIVEYGVGKAVYVHFQKRHGDQMERYEGGERSVKYARAGEWMKQQFGGVHVVMSEWKAEVQAEPGE